MKNEELTRLGSNLIETYSSAIPKEVNELSQRAQKEQRYRIEKHSRIILEALLLSFYQAK